MKQKSRFDLWLAVKKCQAKGHLWKDRKTSAGVPYKYCPRCESSKVDIIASLKEFGIEIEKMKGD